MPIHPMMLHGMFDRPIALLRQLVMLLVGAGLLYGCLLLAVACLPGVFSGGVAAPAALYVMLVLLSVACLRGWQAVAHHRAVAKFAKSIGELEGQNRLLDFKARMETRLSEASSSVHLEKEVNKRERRIQQMAYEGKLSEMRQQSTMDALQRELDYYKKEHHRVHQENRWLKASLRQNHIDLAFLKEHVDRYLAHARPTLLTRVRNLFTLSSPSPAIVKLARSLDDRGAPQIVTAEPSPGAPLLPAR